MITNSHGLRSEHLREDAYCAQIDQQLLAALRETLELQREIEAATSGNRNQEDASRQREAVAAAG